MTAVFEMPISSETLSPEELDEITGSCRRDKQVEWLEQNRWEFFLALNGKPKVGRLYARLKLAGINPHALATTGGWVPDFSGIGG
ncbi:MAG: DUF4224 domain-containing protein [Azoarcus sp.]|jgi:hypothetical protein|nr:DUF4224 domain-containing protein [Azoarcus sp.]